MTTYQTMPPLSQDDADALERSIRTHGMQVPIIVDENGDVIDGHHRKEIADRLGIECPTIHELGKTEAEKVALSISLNLDRRQLTREQRREIIARSIKAEPEVSDREHARRVGASHNTVAAVRNDLESTGQVDQFDSRVGADGKERPASVVSITQRKSESMTETFDAETGEVIETPARALVAEAASDPTVQDAAYMHNFYKAISRAGDFMQFDAERVGLLSDQADFVTLDQLVDGVTRFRDKARKAGSGLRLVGGGQ